VRLSPYYGDDCPSFSWDSSCYSLGAGWKMLRSPSSHQFMSCALEAKLRSDRANPCKRNPVRRITCATLACRSTCPETVFHLSSNKPPSGKIDLGQKADFQGTNRRLVKRSAFLDTYLPCTRRCKGGAGSLRKKAGCAIAFDDSVVERGI